MDGLDWSKFQQHEIEESLMTMPSSSNGPILDSGLTGPPRNLDDQVGVVPGLILDSSGITIDSLDSIDCLLPASNQRDTTTSVEDDGISLIFSNCNTLLWNNNNNNFTGIKSVKPIVSLSKNTEARKDSTNCGSPSQTSPHHHHQNPIFINNQSKRKRAESQQVLDFRRSNNIPTTTDHQPISQNHQKPKRARLRLEKQPITSPNINFQQPPSSSASSSADEPDPEAIAHMKEIIYRAAAFRPVDFGVETVEKPKRKNVRISNDPQTVAARQRRERISERIRVLQRLVPGGSKMDTASMLDEAANYLKFLRSQVKALEALGQIIDQTAGQY